MTDDVLPLLKVHEYFRGASDEALQAVTHDARVVHHAAGAVVHEPTDVPTTVGFVLRGRLKAVRVDDRGTETPFRMIERGEQYGMMVGALAEPIPVRVVALEATTVLVLDYERAMELTLAHPDLRRLWLKSYATGLKRLFFGTAPKRAAMVLVLIHESPATRPTAGRLIRRLRELGEEIGVLADSDACREVPGVRFRSLRDGEEDLSVEEVRRQTTAWEDAARIVFDVEAANLTSDRATRLLGLADRVVYFVPTELADAAVRRLGALGVAAHGWREKVAVAWLLPAGTPVAPVVPALYESVGRDFKVSESPPAHPYGLLLSGGLERLVHDLRGVRIGLALGGGAARGLAHLGVLKVLDQAGVVLDMLAGTSAGAMTGLIYGSGLDPIHTAGCFTRDLRPSWPFRRLPRGEQWYLVYKYRTGRFDGMLRPYLHDWRLEQLPLPCLSVAVDLVGGRSVVRDRGDAVHAVLESINLPVLSVPIVRDGQALVDGGIVNNIPADVLVAAGCNFVIAVSVSAKMEHRFCDITPGRSTPRHRPGAVQTLLRSLLVQNHNLHAVGVGPADVVIEPDVTGFDMAEFTRAEELAVIGQTAATDQVARVRRLLHRLDPQLFPASGPSSSIAMN